MEELDGSALGTLSYWEDAYRKELKEFEARGDPGEVWFGEDSAHRVADWLIKSDHITADTSIIDIGCGNGYSLLELARAGFSRLTGVDYSPDAIALAQKLAAKESQPEIVYKVFDVTAGDVSALGKYGIVHDKGTYDAVSLNPEDPKTKRERYMDSVVRLLDSNGIFVITSCNWTEGELVEQFAGRFRLVAVVPTPQFRFGGKVGSVVTTAVFNVNKEG